LSAFSEHGHKLRFFRTHFRNTNTNDKPGDFFGCIFGPSIFTILLSAFLGGRHNLQIRRFFGQHFRTVNIQHTIVRIFGVQTQFKNPDIFSDPFSDDQYSLYYCPHFWGTDTIYKSGDFLGDISGPLIFTVLLSAFLGHRHNLQIRRFFRPHFQTINIQHTIVRIFEAQTQFINPEIFSDAKIPLSHWANLCSISFLTVIVHLAQ
jgi:hypothetical protein